MCSYVLIHVNMYAYAGTTHKYIRKTNFFRNKVYIIRKYMKTEDQVISVPYP